jgi:hypothetical protein
VRTTAAVDPRGGSSTRKATSESNRNQLQQANFVNPATRLAFGREIGMLPAANSQIRQTAA